MQTEAVRRARADSRRSPSCSVWSPSAASTPSPPITISRSSGSSDATRSGTEASAVTSMLESDRTVPPSGVTSEVPVAGNCSEQVGGAEDLGRAGQVEQLQLVDGDQGDEAFGVHGSIVGDRGDGSKDKILMIPAMTVSREPDVTPPLR